MDFLTGGAIAKIAFDEFVKSSAGEVAKKAVGGAIEQLRAAIKARFQGTNAKAEAAIAKIEQERSVEALTKLSVYLDDEMEDAPFAQTLQQLAQQVINIGKQEQKHTAFTVETHGDGPTNTVGTLDNSGSGDVVFGDKFQGDKVAGDKYI
jgi:hypothetical protein